MPNPWMSFWLSATNSWAGAMRGFSRDNRRRSVDVQIPPQFDPVKLIVLFATALLLLAASPGARAQGGPYLQVFAGPNFLPSEDFEFDEGGLSGRVEPDYELGFNLGGAVGYRFNDFFRIEAELGYQRHGLDAGGAEGLAVAVEDLDGDGTILSGMVNGYVDGDFGYPGKPFIGLGIGAARVSLNEIGGTLSTAPILPGLPVVEVEVDKIIDDEDTVFAVQAIAGVSFDVAEHWATAISYRFFGVLDADFETEEVAGLIDPEPFDADFYSHAIRVELRYRF